MCWNLIGRGFHLTLALAEKNLKVRPDSSISAFIYQIMIECLANPEDIEAHMTSVHANPHDIDWSSERQKVIG